MNRPFIATDIARRLTSSFSLLLMMLSCAVSSVEGDPIGSITFTATGFILEKGSVTLTPATRRDVQIDVGAPMMAGVDTFVIDPPGGANGTVTLNLNGNETAAMKADLLAAMLTAKQIPFTRDGTKFTFNVDKISAFDRTHERIAFSFQMGPRVGAIGPRQGVLDYHGAVAGLDSTGSESIFETALGFDRLLDSTAESVRASAGVAFGDLVEPTVDSLLESMFNELRLELPEAWRSNLALDLNRDRITFAFPDDAVNLFVHNFTSDVTTRDTIGIVYEPGVFLVLGSGLIGLFFRGRRWL